MSNFKNNSLCRNQVNSPLSIITNHQLSLNIINVQFGKEVKYNQSESFEL